MKRCSKCNKVKSLTDFGLKKIAKDGRRSQCRICRRLEHIENRDHNLKKAARYRQEHPETIFLWRKNNREHINNYNNRWAAAHREHVREKARKQIQRNPAPNRTRARLWYANNVERGKARTKKWVKDHPEHAKRLRREGKRKRRLVEMDARGHATSEQISARIEFWGSCCWLNPAHPYEAIDHVIPLALGGTGWPANIRPICKRCNSSKGAKHPSVVKHLHAS